MATSPVATSPPPVTTPTSGSSIPSSPVGDAKVSESPVVSNPLGQGMAARLRNLGLQSTSPASAGRASVQEIVVTRGPVQQQPTSQIKPEDIISPVLVHSEKAPIVKMGEAGNKQVPLLIY